jgi:apolipoprotein N-acyltransferase
MTSAIAIIFEALAFFVKHWKLALAFAALSGVGVEGFHLARAWDAKAAAVAQAEKLKHDLATVTLVQANDAKQAKADQEELSKLKEKANATPKNDAAGLDRAAVGRLRSIR